MWILFQFFTLSLLLCRFSPAVESLRCLVCLSKVNKRCKFDPEFSSQLCPQSSKGCFTAMLDFDDYVRGCAHMATKAWRERCVNNTAMGCTFCNTDDCNDHIFEKNERQSCVICDGESCKTETLLTPCTDRIIHSSPQYCFYYHLDGKVVKKGCGTHSVLNPPANSMNTVCQGHGCNLELPNTYSACYKYSGHHNDYYKRTLQLCHNDSTPFWQPGCFYTPPWTDENLQTGCLSHLDPVTARKCTRYDFRMHCQYCTGDTCNEMSLIQSNFTNRCQAPPNAMQYCSNLHIRCFVSWLRVWATQSDKNSTWIVQLNGGCVEPGLNPFLLVAPQTHYCDNLHSNSVPCMDIYQNFSKRISCYRCSNCENVFEMDHRIKHLCPVGTTHCYQVMGRDMRVRRGCDHPLDEHIEHCTAFLSTCHKCDFNYCNSNTVGKSYGQCYKTRPYHHRKHLLTMRLEDCMGTGFRKLWPDCYVAEMIDSLIIEAGCVNELQPEDIIRHKSLKMGGITVVEEDLMSCYKCQSNRTEYCYNTRWVNPETCRGARKYATRGCYTLFLRDSVQRGCLSELDLYHQQMCVQDNFEDACAVCDRSYCNIHVP